MATTLIIRNDGAVVRDAPLCDIGHAWRDEQAIVWIDFDRPPNVDEQQILMEVLGLDERAMEHISHQHMGPRAVRFRSHMLVVIYDVALAVDTAAVETDEIVFLIGDRFLVSAHGPGTTRVPDVAERLDPYLDQFGIEAAAIAFPIIESVVDQYLLVVEAVRQMVDALEERVLKLEEQDGITALYRLRRALTSLRRVIASEESLIGARAAPSAFVANPEIQEAMLDVKHDMQSAVDDIDQYLSILPGILTTFEALKSDSLNRIVKLLTVWSIILTAVALFPTVLGISLSREPSISPFVGYVISVGAMVLVGSSIWYIFKRHGWTE